MRPRERGLGHGDSYVARQMGTRCASMIPSYVTEMSNRHVVHLELIYYCISTVIENSKLLKTPALLGPLFSSQVGWGGEWQYHQGSRKGVGGTGGPIPLPALPSSLGAGASHLQPRAG